MRGSERRVSLIVPLKANDVLSIHGMVVTPGGERRFCRRAGLSSAAE